MRNHDDENWKEMVIVGGILFTMCIASIFLALYIS